MPFDIHFVAMGLGDCTMLECPDGKIILIDCGLAKKDRKNIAKKAINSAKNHLHSIAANKGIEAIILTHPDKDHYSQIPFFLTNYPQKTYLTVNALYFSSSPDITNSNLHKKLKSSLGALYPYSIQNVSNLFYNDTFKTKKYFEPEYYDTKHTDNRTKEWDKNTVVLASKRSVKSWSNSLVPPSIVVASGTETINSNTDYDWSVEIIGGNAGKYSNLSDEKEIANANSLITIIKYDSKVMLCTADAHDITLEYIRTAHSVLIQNLELVTAPHHGSEAHVNQNFINDIKKLNHLAVSTQNTETRFNFPRYKGGIEDYVSKVPQNYASHKIEYWDSTYGTYLHDLYTKWKNTMGVTVITEGKFIYRTPIDTDNISMLHDRTTKGYKFTSKSTKENVFMTSQGSVRCTLDHNGITVKTILP